MNWSRVALITLILVTGGALSQDVPLGSVYSKDGVSYGTYFNGRFGFAAAVPLDYLQPEAGALGGSGQVFSAPTGEELRVFGSTLLLENDLAEAYSVLSQDTPDRQVTYKVEREDWFVVSGFDGDTVFYTKVMLHPESGAYLTLTLRYDRSLKPTFDPITEEVVRSFRALEGVGGG